MEKKYFDSKEFCLENGLRIICIKTFAELFSINIGVKVGSMHEAEDEKGLSHFVEHMVFKGTKKRSNNMVNEDIEGLGGSYNAFTTYSETVYGFTALNEEFENSVEILSDLTLNPAFPEDELEKEKEVIVSEIRADLDDLEQCSYNNINSEAFERSFLRWDIAGSEGHVRSYTAGDLRAFYEKHYIPNNSVIAVASPFEYEHVVSTVEKYFSSWKKRDEPKIDIEDEQNAKKEILIRKPDLEQSSIVYLYTFYGLSRREEIALDIINYRLGESSNSLLFKKLREEKALTYEGYSSMDSSEHVKTLYIYTSLSRSNIEEAKSTIDKIIEEIVEGNLIEEKNINLMKKTIRTSIASALLDPEHICSYVLTEVIEGREVYDFGMDLELLSSITRDEILSVAGKVFKNPTTQIISSEE